MKRERDSKIELLRIIAMVTIIFHHLCLHGGVLSNTKASITSLAFSGIFFPGGKICLITFIVITAWYSSEMQFDGKKFLRIWFEVLFYNIVGMVLAIIFNKNSMEITSRNVIGTLFPITGNSHGFVVAYMIFILLLPSLQIASKKMSRKNIMSMAILLVVIQYGTKVINAISDYMPYVQISSEILTFIAIYFIVLYMKRYLQNKIASSHIYIGVLAVLWGGIGTFNILENITSKRVFSQISAVFFNDESSIFNIIAGICLFIIFNNIRLKQSYKVVNSLASHMLAVLLIHDHNYFRYVLWNDMINVNKICEIPGFRPIMIFCLSAIIIVALSTVIDMIRVIIEKQLFKTKTIISIAEVLDTLFSVDGKV